jgi:hypothetical protein
MQNIKGISVNEGTAPRELSLDEAEMVGGGFSWGGLVHNVEHAAGNVLNAGETALGTAFGTVAGGGLAVAGGKLAIKVWKAASRIKLPKAPFEEPGVPELPPEIFLG